MYNGLVKMIKVIQLLKELSKTPQRTQCYFEKLAYFENPVVKTTHLGKNISDTRNQSLESGI